VCGFVGLIGVERSGPALSAGLQALQHRGQDACGIATHEGGRVHLFKDLGQVASVFTPEILADLRGSGGIGHVRYPTAGSASATTPSPSTPAGRAS